MTDKKNTDFNDQAAALGSRSVTDHIERDLAAMTAERDRQSLRAPQADDDEEGDSIDHEDPPPPDAPPANVPRENDHAWHDLFERNQYGHYKASVRNVELVLNNHEDWRGVLGYCEFSYRIIKRRDPPMLNCTAGEWDDADTAALRIWMSYAFGFTPTHQDIADAIVVIARRNRFHPVREYLNGLTWDGISRGSTWLARAFESTDDDRYLEIIGPKVLIAAVARVMRPGCKMDNVMILEGEQGKGKSTVISILFGEWFTDAPLPIGDKDAYMVIQGKWGLELAELDAFNKAEVTQLKHFFSQQIDRFRPSYGRVAQDHPRQTTFWGTTNQDAYLRDYTGNRRFWPVYCVTVNKQWVRDNRNQLWAEALHRFQENERWWVSQESEADQLEFSIVKEAQDARLQRDPWEDVLIDYLAGITKPHLTSMEILKEAIGFDAAHIQQAHMNRLAPIMKALGWKGARKRIPDARGKLVQRRVWIRMEERDWGEVPL